MTRRPVDGGYVTPAFVAVVGLTMVLLVMAANLLAVHHARGVLQAAVEEGARQGVAAGESACRARVAAVVDRLGALRAGVGPPTCQIGPSGAVVQLAASFPGWLPGMPAEHVTAVGRAAGRPAP